METDSYTLIPSQKYAFKTKQENSIDFWSTVQYYILLYGEIRNNSYEFLDAQKFQYLLETIHQVKNKILQILKEINFGRNGFIDKSFFAKFV